MLTVCPYPECQYEHIQSSGESKWSSICPRCNRPGALRPPDVWRGINKRAEFYAQQNQLKGEFNFDISARVCCAVLEDIRSLWNVGSMFRTADAMGIGKLFLTGITGSPPRKEIAKTSLGAEDHVPWSYHRHALDIVPELKAQGYVVLALERCTGSKPISEIAEQFDPSRRIALIVGNEVMGVSPETLALCDAVAELPMCGIKESLNVAVAFGVAAYALAFFLPGSVTTDNTKLSGKTNR